MKTSSTRCQALVREVSCDKGANGNLFIMFARTARDWEAWRGSTFDIPCLHIRGSKLNDLVGGARHLLLLRDTHCCHVEGSLSTAFSMASDYSPAVNTGAIRQTADAMAGSVGVWYESAAPHSPPLPAWIPLDLIKGFLLHVLLAGLLSCHHPHCFRKYESHIEDGTIIH